VVAVGRSLTKKKINEAQTALNSYSTLKGYRLKVIQGTGSDSIIALSHRLYNQATGSAEQQKLLEQTAEENTHLKTMLAGYQQYDRLSRDIRREIKVISPGVKAFSLTSTLQISTDTLPARRFVTAIVSVAKPLPDAHREQLRLWLKERSHADSLRLIVTR
ncbi:MAG TPA: TIGR00341 family protein, partial [Prevotella sp.]